jgi:hypothetical protein
MRKKWAWTGLFILMLLGACTSFATPQPSQTAPAVTVLDQEIVHDEFLSVARVVSPGPGWIVIYTDAGGQPDAIIGYAPVKPGENQDVVVKVNGSAASPVLYAVLFMDRGTVGKFEFPGPDQPVQVGGKRVMAAFQASHD